MATETIKEFLVGIGFKVDESGLKSFSNKVASFAKGIGFAIGGATAAFATLKYAVQQTANKFDDLGSAADRIGTTSEALERLSFIAENSGAKTQTLTNSLERFSEKIGEVSRGKGKALDVFEKLGLSVTNADGSLKSATELFDEFGDSIKDLSRVEQLDLMNKVGIDRTLLQTLTEGGDALGAEFDEIAQKGSYSINALSKKSTAFNNSIRKMQYTFATFKYSLVESILEPLKDSSDTIAKTFRDLMSGLLKVLRPLLKFITTIFAGIVKVLSRFLQGAKWAISGIYNAFKYVFDALPNWAKVIGGFTIALYALWKALAVSPLGAVVALALAIGALVDDFLVWKAGGQSLIDWSAWEPAINSAISAIESIIQFFRDLTSAVFAVIGALGELFSGDVDGFFNQMRVAIDSVIEAFKNLFGWMQSVRDFFGNALGGAGSWIKSGLNKLGVTAFDGILPSAAPVLASDRTQNNNQNVKVENQIIVQGSANPEATGQAVAKASARAYSDAARNNRVPAL